MIQPTFTIESVAADKRQGIQLYLEARAVPKRPDEAQKIEPPATCFAFLKINVRRLRGSKSEGRIQSDQRDSSS